MEKNPEDLKEQLENMLDSFINDAQELPDDYYHHMDDAEEQYFAKKRKRRKKKKEPSVSSFIPKETREDFGNQFSDWNPDPTSDDY